MKYIDADRLRAKIEKYLTFDNNIDTAYYIGRRDAERSILALIDSLQQKEPDKDLEEAAEKYSDKYCSDWAYRLEYEDAFIAGAEWQAKRSPLPEDTLIFRKGVEEGRRLMMEDAVEGEVIKTNKHTSVRYKSYYGTDRYFYGIANKQFKAGDKVRIIIVKEDGQ